VLKEIRKTVYVPKCVLLGSRDKLCVNESLRSENGEQAVAGAALRLACKDLDRACPYRHSSERGPPRIPQESLDIEELVQLTRELKICPYYLNKEDHEQADIVLMPYNYLLSRAIRDAVRLKLDGAVVIIDEAHNIAGAAEDAMSFEISTEQLGRIEHELSYLLSKVDAGMLEREFGDAFEYIPRMVENAEGQRSGLL